MSESDTIARGAAEDYQCISALIDEMENAGDDPEVALSQTERFVVLHHSFYEKIIRLIAEGGVSVDEEFVSEVAQESKILQQLIERIRGNQGSLLKRIIGPSLESLQDHFGDIVEGLVENYGIDPETNEIVFNEDDIEN